MGKMIRMDKNGDTQIEWEVADTDSVQLADRLFGKAIGEGFMAFEVAPNGQSELITEFDPEATEIMFVPRIAGG